MGYAKELKSVIDEALAEKCEDDQTNINTVCQKSEFVKVDEEEKIFKNFGPLDKKHDTDAIFVSYPGSPGFDRYTRAIVEYTQFLYMYILCLIILGSSFLSTETKSFVTYISSIYKFLCFCCGQVMHSPF
jgi:hypothetical protein